MLFADAPVALNKSNSLPDFSGLESVNMAKNSASRVRHSVNRLLSAYLERISRCCLVNKKCVQSHNFLCGAQILLDIRGIIP